MPSYHSALESFGLAVELGAEVRAAASVNGNGVDMQGWDGVAFMLSIGAMVASSTIDMRVLGSANANFSGAINITNAAITQVLAAMAPNIVAVVDVYRPTNRYVRVNTTVAAANANYSVTSVRYRGQSRLPGTLPANFQYIKVQEN